MHLLELFGNAYQIDLNWLITGKGARRKGGREIQAEPRDKNGGANVGGIQEIHHARERR